MLDGLVEVRQGSDDDDFYVISKEEVAQQLQNDAVEQYLLMQYRETE